MTTKFWLDSWSGLGILFHVATNISLVDTNAILVQDFLDSSV